jgi:predicted nuclease with TOPRIM domain
MLKMRGGVVPTDIEMRDRFKQLQQENQRLKEMVDQGLVEKLKKENVHLKQQILNRSNDALSDSFIQQLPHFRTVEQDDLPS